jgi:16S rRNA (uracil1498-N3)-methyltransferase
VGDRFYCPGAWRDGRAVLEADEARHLARVRRVGVGERVELFDGTGRTATGEVATIGRDRVELTIVGDGPPGRDLAGELILATAVPKGERFDWLVEKATELGVTRLVPIRAERSSVDPRGSKLDRLRRVVVEACKQSGRARLMALDEPTDWADWLALGSAGAALCLLAHPGGGRVGEAEGFDLAAGVAVAVGPEGGFTEAEVAAAVAAGYRTIGLGPTILRVETAAVAACAAVLACRVGG